MNSKNIVVVDDDELVISALKTLLKLEEFTDVDFFTSPVKALEHIKTKKPALILSDFMMPGVVKDMNSSKSHKIVCSADEIKGYVK